MCVELAKNVARQAKTVRQEKGAKASAAMRFLRRARSLTPFSLLTNAQLREEHLLERLEKVRGTHSRSSASRLCFRSLPPAALLTR